MRRIVVLAGGRCFLATSAQQALEAIKGARETATPRPPMRRSGRYTGLDRRASKVLCAKLLTACGDPVAVCALARNTESMRERRLVDSLARNTKMNAMAGGYAAR